MARDIDNKLKTRLAYRVVRSISFWALIAAGHALAFVLTFIGAILQDDADAVVIEEEEVIHNRSSAETRESHGHLDPLPEHF